MLNLQVTTELYSYWVNYSEVNIRFKQTWGQASGWVTNYFSLSSSFKFKPSPPHFIFKPYRQERLVLCLLHRRNVSIQIETCLTHVGEIQHPDHELLFLLEPGRSRFSHKKTLNSNLTLNLAKTCANVFSVFGEHLIFSSTVHEAFGKMNALCERCSLFWSTLQFLFHFFTWYPMGISYFKTNSKGLYPW